MEYVIPALVGIVAIVFGYVLYEVYQILKIDFKIDDLDDN
jgi:hypothetical protein